jgi:hypothetical protein
MDISDKIIWQQASGDTERDYSELCLKWDVILNGPGYAGPWPDCAKVLSKDGSSSRKITDLRRFSEEMKDGDFVVLRLGTANVLGVGQIVGSYEWRDEFGDIDGWDIQHVRRVRWLWRYAGTPKQFDTYALKQGDTTQKVDRGPVTEWLSSLEIPVEAVTRPLKDLPKCSDLKQGSLDDVSEYLFDHGVASGSIAKLLEDIGELVRIAKWYKRSGMPSENETIAYLVVPLLRALGWPSQRMAIEWHHVDVALFAYLPRRDESLMAVLEAKKMDASCLTAMAQANGYAKNKSSCLRLIVTDGLRYGIYVRHEGDEFRLYAYMNLTNLRHDCPIYGCKGVKDALLAMAPEWKSPDDRQ